MTLTAVPGVEVGHWTDDVGLTGVTVVVLPEPNVTAVEVRGGAPGSRETALLAPGMRVETVQAICLAGGSAFGLAAADGVMAELEAEGRGHPTLAGPVPIVPAAVVFDRLIGDTAARPGPEGGRQALQAASGAPVEQGSVGAGTGTVVAGWRGFEHFVKAGVGSASLTVGQVTVGALVVVNAVGDAFTLEGEPLTGGKAVSPLMPWARMPLENTTLVVIATDAAASRSDLSRLMVRAHDALAVCLRPAHTRYDGDAVFAVSCGAVEADLDAVGEAAFRATGRAIEAALRAAQSRGGIATMRDA